jgi:hypothetical protein
MKKILVAVIFVLIAVTETFADRCDTLEGLASEFVKTHGGTVTRSGEYAPPLTRNVKNPNGTVTEIPVGPGEAGILKLHFNAMKDGMDRLKSIFLNVDTQVISESDSGETRVHLNIVRYDLIAPDKRIEMGPLIDEYTKEFQARHGGKIVSFAPSGESSEGRISTYILPQDKDGTGRLRTAYFNGMEELIRTGDLAAVLNTDWVISGSVRRATPAQYVAAWREEGRILGAEYEVFDLYSRADMLMLKDCYMKLAREKNFDFEKYGPNDRSVMPFLSRDEKEEFWSYYLDLNPLPDLSNAKSVGEMRRLLTGVQYMAVLSHPPNAEPYWNQLRKVVPAAGRLAATAEE